MDANTIIENNRRIEDNERNENDKGGSTVYSGSSGSGGMAGTGVGDDIPLIVDETGTLGTDTTARRNDTIPGFPLQNEDETGSAAASGLGYSAAIATGTGDPDLTAGWRVEINEEFDGDIRNASTLGYTTIEVVPGSSGGLQVRINDSVDNMIDITGGDGMFVDSVSVAGDGLTGGGGTIEIDSALAGDFLSYAGGVMDVDWQDLGSQYAGQFLGFSGGALNVDGAGVITAHIGDGIGWDFGLSQFYVDVDELDGAGIEIVAGQFVVDLGVGLVFGGNEIDVNYGTGLIEGVGNTIQVDPDYCLIFGETTTVATDFVPIGDSSGTWDYLDLSGSNLIVGCLSSGPQTLTDDNVHSIIFGTANYISQDIALANTYDFLCQNPYGSDIGSTSVPFNNVNAERYYSFADDAASQFLLYRFNGSIGSETKILNGDAIGMIRMFGYHGGSDYDEVVRIIANAAEDFDSGADSGTSLTFNVTDVGDGSYSEYMKLDGATETVTITKTLKHGTHNAIGAETVTGYITIKDSGGTDRKLAVVS